MSFGVGPESDSQLCCLLAVTLGKFLDIQALVFSLINGDSASTHFLGFQWELNGLMLGEGIA